MLGSSPSSRFRSLWVLSFCLTEEVQSATYRDEGQTCYHSRNGSNINIHISVPNAVPQGAFRYLELFLFRLWRQLSSSSAASFASAWPFLVEWYLGFAA